MPTLVGYILIQTESQSVQGVNSYDILFAGMSNVWKRYLFANPVTYYNNVYRDCLQMPCNLYPVLIDSFEEYRYFTYCKYIIVKLK